MALLDEHIDGKYEILGKIREGGMGAIYKVRHRLLDEVRVVKVIRSQADAEGEGADRFLREARAANKLRHPNVAVLHDFAVTGDGQAFIVMEYIDGWNLLEVLNGYGPPPLSLTLEVARQSLKALGYLHRHRIVHRDVSPDNLMLTRDVDGNPLVKLIDLGIAKALEGQGGLTTTGVFLGKPRYGSPERFGGGAWDSRSDLYSFGVVLYELLTGRSPITGDDPASLMAGHLFRPPLDFAETDPQGRVPAELRALVLKALAKTPDERIASAEEFVWDLGLIQDRHPLTRDDLGKVWSVLLPLDAGSEATPVRPGSTQNRLDMEFELRKTPPTGTMTGESTLRTVPALVPPPPSEPTRRVTPVEDLDATWASRPLRKEGAARPEPAPAAVSAVAVVAAAASVPEGRARRGAFFGVAAGIILLALAGGGFWWSRRQAPTVPSSPPPRASETILPARAVVETPVEAAPLKPEPAKQEAQAPAAKVPAPAPQPETEAVPAPVEPMKPGDLILARQPGVEPAEIRDLPFAVYPEAAKGSGKKPSIRVAVLVDETGTVIDAQVRSGDKSGLGFNEAALEAARKARFFPATRDTIAGKMWSELLFEFAE
ncbi:MAG: TonB family protein [Thermoanaerobaculia bacterium]